MHNEEPREERRKEQGKEPRKEQRKDTRDKQVPLVSPWPLGLAERLPRPGLSVGLAVGALTALVLWLAGAYNPAMAPPFWATTEQVASMAIAYPVLLGYVTGMMLFASGRSVSYADALAPVLKDSAAEPLRGLNRLSRSRLRVATGIGLLVAVMNIDYRTVLGLRDVPANSIDVALAAASMMIWVLIVRFIYVRLHNSLLLADLGRHHTAVDLYRPQTLRPFAQAGILDLLIVMAGLALSPLQALDAEFRIENYGWALALCLPVAIASPLVAMWGVRARIVATKRTALGALDEAIAAASKDLEDAALGRLDLLLARRNYIREQHDWPMDLRIVGRAAFYLVIPPLAWIGAALVEMLLEATLRS